MATGGAAGAEAGMGIGAFHWSCWGGRGSGSARGSGKASGWVDMLCDSEIFRLIDSARVRGASSGLMAFPMS